MHEARRTSTSLRLLIAVAMSATVALVGSTTSTADPEPTLDEVRAQVEELHQQAAEATERYNLALDEVAAIERRLAKAKSAVEKQESRVEQLVAELGGFAAAAYRTGGADLTIEALLAEDPSEFLAQVSVVDAFVTQQAETLAAVELERQLLEQRQLIAAEELTRSEAVTAMLQEEQSAIDRLLGEQEQFFDRLSATQRAAFDSERAREHEAALAAREAAAARLSRAVIGDALAATGRAAKAVTAALSKIGSTYVYGGKGPNSFDCSGFTRWAWSHAGVSLPPASRLQINEGQPVSADDLQPGDLLFYGTPVSHVAMYIGQGQVVHASNPRSGVTIAPAMRAGGSRKPFVGAVRPG